MPGVTCSNGLENQGSTTSSIQLRLLERRATACLTPLTKGRDRIDSSLALPFSLFVAAFVCCLNSQAVAMDLLKFEQEGTQYELSGEIVVEAADGGVMFRSRDGRLWLVQPNEITSKQSDDRPFEPLSQEEIAEQLLGRLPEGFRVHTTKHYVICYNTSPVYAEWVGALYERLHRAFFNYWENNGLDIAEPRMPLPVLVFDSQTNYLRHVREELGTEPGTIIGYYHMLSNAVTMFDLTGTQEGGGKRQFRSPAQINALLSRPGAESMVATIVHEATHQLACNSGMQQRFGAVPFWVSEGLAIYFESPDLKSRRGWRGIGNVNRIRHRQFLQYISERPRDSLLTLLQSDARFRKPDDVLNAYAEAWALNYFLLTRQRDDYVEYLKVMKEKKPLVEESPEQRVREFQEHFGEDLSEFDSEFLEFMTRVR